MQDKKLQIIFDNYSDSLYAKNAQQEVEAMRTGAYYLGGGITTAAFVANEFARLSMRSPLFKLKPVNVAAAVFLPTLIATQATSADVEKRIENMWRVHRNRTDRGLGATYKTNGVNESANQGHNFIVPNVNISSEMLFEGALPNFWNMNPFIRHHENIFQYSGHLYDIEDHPKIHFDNFERLKKFAPKKKSTIGVTKIIPQQDNDEAWEYYDIQGESLYSNPPNQ